MTVPMSCVIPGICTYATNDEPYASGLRRLETAAAKFGMPFNGKLLPTKAKSRLAGVSYKPKYMQEVLKDRTLIWCDADDELLAPVELPQGRHEHLDGADIMFVRNPETSLFYTPLQWAASVIVICPTKGARVFLKNWQWFTGKMGMNAHRSMYCAYFSVFGRKKYNVRFADATEYFIGKWKQWPSPLGTHPRKEPIVL